MQIGDIAVAFVAFFSLIFLVLILLSKLIGLLKHWRKALEWVTLIGASGATGLIVVSIAVFTAVTAYTQQTDRRIMQQCTPLYGRQVRAYAASDDYFGQQLSKTIAGEAKECAEYASTKRASDVTASTLGAIDAAQDSSTEDLSSRIRKPYTPA